LRARTSLAHGKTIFVVGRKRGAIVRKADDELATLAVLRAVGERALVGHRGAVDVIGKAIGAVFLALSDSAVFRRVSALQPITLLQLLDGLVSAVTAICALAIIDAVGAHDRNLGHDAQNDD
jgi:hypothetical protein